MKALGYIRISKDEEGSVSLDYQRAETVKYCKREGLKLIGIETGRGISGKSIKARPAVQRVLQAVETQAIDAVVVYKSDRMSRDGIESLQIEKLFLRRGVKYLSVTEGDLTGDNLDSELLSYLRAGLNARERRLIALRTRQALQRKREKAEPIGGRPAYGWKVENGEVVPEPKEREVIDRMKTLQVKGYSTRDIVRALEQDGFHTRTGTPFSQTQIVRILKAA
ncbi:MAG: recombinase family protein [Desulfomonile tiedjei]|uniref:Recombinase family protein n=1 Tax=Desulfomonile tiedjei TaxID=2358 RepID=A0A9D6Z4Y0_9BACT|nr:recombinase family protein [Desulfomonile tiedjei]